MLKLPKILYTWLAVSALFFAQALNEISVSTIAPVSPFKNSDQKPQLTPFKKDNESYRDILISALNANSNEQARFLLAKNAIYGMRFDCPVINLQEDDDKITEKIIVINHYFKDNLLNGIFYNHLSKSKDFLEMVKTHSFSIDAGAYIQELLEELLYNSAYVFDGRAERKFIIALALDEKQNEIKIFSVDNGPGIEDIPLSVETDYSTYQDKSPGFGTGRGLTLPLINLYYFKGGEVVVESRGKKYSYTYDPVDDSFSREESVSSEKTLSVTSVFITLPLPKETLLRNMRSNVVYDRIKTMNKRVHQTKDTIVARSLMSAS